MRQPPRTRNGVGDAFQMSETNDRVGKCSLFLAVQNIGVKFFSFIFDNPYKDLKKSCYVTMMGGWKWIV